jgi:hypothetical protein
MKKKAESSCAIGRISITARILDAMEPLLDEQRVQPADRPQLNRATINNLVTELFPLASEEDAIPDDLAERPPPLELTAEEVRTTLRQLKVDKAAGNSGWTNRNLRKIANFGTWDEQEVFADRLTAVFNMLLSGNADPALHELWTPSRLAFIPKDDMTFRPIGIGEVLFRCIGSTVMRVHGPALAEILAPLQLAVGVKGGVEIAAVIVDLGHGGRSSDTAGHADDVSTMSIDIKNAFNSIRRRRVLDGLLEMFPPIVSFFRWVYGEPIE